MIARINESLIKPVLTEQASVEKSRSKCGEGVKCMEPEKPVFEAQEPKKAPDTHRPVANNLKPVGKVSLDKSEAMAMAQLITTLRSGKEPLEGELVKALSEPSTAWSLLAQAGKANDPRALRAIGEAAPLLSPEAAEKAATIMRDVYPLKSRQAQATLDALCDRAGLAAKTALTQPQNTVDKPTFDKPKFDKPTFDKPTFDKPTFDKPTFDKPTVDKPQFDADAVSDKPGLVNKPTLKLKDVAEKASIGQKPRSEPHTASDEPRAEATALPTDVVG